MPPKRKKIELPFAKVLDQLLVERKIGIREAARLAGVPMATLQDWRSGSSPSDLVAVQRLARALGVSLSFLLLGVHDEGSNQMPSVSEVFDLGPELFDGYCAVSIRKLVPRNPGGTSASPSSKKRSGK